MMTNTMFEEDSGFTTPYWTRKNTDGTIRIHNSTTADWYMQAHPGDQFYRFKYSEG